MKKLKMVSAVTLAVLSMSVSAMAMPSASSNQICDKIDLQSINLQSIDLQNLDLQNLNGTNFTVLNDKEALDCILNNSGLNLSEQNDAIKDLIANNGNSDCFDFTNINNNWNQNTNNGQNNSKDKDTNKWQDKDKDKDKDTDKGQDKPNTGNNNNNNTTPNTGANQGTSTPTSQYANKVVELVNVERAKGGLSPLSTDSKVAAAAQVRAKEIKTSFSHTRPDGRTAFTALDESGASYRGAGENIAIGQRTPEQVVNDWMNSEGHRANIMNGSFKYIGVGVDGTAWTQLFTH